MIARVWHGWTTPENADTYEALSSRKYFRAFLLRMFPASSASNSSGGRSGTR